MMVYLSSRPVRMATTMPNKYSEKTMEAPSCPKNAAEKTAKIARRAPQDINGAIMTVIRRSRGASSVRAPIIDGTLQPNPTMSGTKDLPGRPSACISLHHERGARHVTGIFKEGEEQIHHADLRHQRQNGVDPAAHALREENGQPLREVQGKTNPLHALNENRSGTNIENRLQRTADVDRQNEHQVHHQQENRYAEETVEDHAVQHLRQFIRRGEVRVADFSTQLGNGLIARIGDQ